MFWTANLNATMKASCRRSGSIMLAASMLLPPSAIAQTIAPGGPASAALPQASHIIMPQATGFPLERGRPGIVIESVQADVRIVEQAASTTLQIALRNPGPTQAEAVLLLPVPEGAVVSSFMFEGAASEPTAKVLSREEARRLYDQIVGQVRDPALLEFAGYNLIRSSVFPVPPQGAQAVRVTYEQVLDTDGDRIDFVLPRSESLDRRVPWRIALDIAAKHPITTVYSPSHDLVTERRAAERLRVRLADSAATTPGPFLLSYLLERNGVTASLLAYPDPSIGGGYFLLMTGLPTHDAPQAGKVRREVTIVLDRSGSMAGAKMDQARDAALQVVEGLADGEAFNIIDYSTTVSALAPKPLIKNPQTTLEARRYIQSLRPGGGTNIHDALLEALRQPPTSGMLPLVLFLTDGLPTVGPTNESVIRELVVKGNPHQRRVFTFGVGHDVNVPLLDRLADATRATATYVLPQENVEVKVAQVFRRLYGPVLARPALDSAGAFNRIADLMPVNLPDVFEGDQFVVLGRYRDGAGPLSLRLRGEYLGQPREFAFQFDLDSASTRHAFVPRLWASRRIAYLVDLIRQAGAGSTNSPVPAGASIFDDPRFRELAAEVLDLSTRFGILTEYTSFLATEGTNLRDWNLLAEACNDNLEGRAVRERSGAAAVNQGMNYNDQKGQSKLNYDNRYVDAQMQSVQVANVQQMCDRGLFKRGRQWVDGNLVNAAPSRDGRVQDQVFTPDAVIDYGTREHLDLVHSLARENRQGLLALPGEILIRIGERTLLIRNPVE